MLKEPRGQLEWEAAAASGPVAAVAAGGPVSAGGLWLGRMSRCRLVSMGAGALTVLLGDIERHANQVAGYRIEVLAALGVAGEAGEAEGLRGASCREAVRDATGVSDRTARELCRVAAKARRSEPIMEALAGGDINTEQAESPSDARVPDDVRDRLIAAAASPSVCWGSPCIVCRSLHPTALPGMPVRTPSLGAGRTRWPLTTSWTCAAVR